MFTATVTNFGALPQSIFGRASAHAPEVPTQTQVKASARYYKAARLAADVLPVLPEPGTSEHYLLLGTFDWMQVVSAITDRIPECKKLTIASLCYSKRNATEILGLLERHPALELVMLVSRFFVSHNQDMHERFVEELKSYPGRVRLGSSRSHAKITAWSGADLVCESSCNLRTSGNRETATFFLDRGLTAFHEKWISEVVDRDGAKETAPES